MFFKFVKPFLQNYQEIECKKGEVIYYQGDTPQNIYFVHEGIVGLFHITESGKETFLRIFTSGSVMGHRSYLAKEQYHASSVALEKTSLIVISRDECERICLEEPQLIMNLAQIMAKDLGSIELRMSGLSDKSVTKRIVDSLLFLKLRHPHHIWTRKEIAEYSGSTFETVTRVMTQLTELGLIEKQGRDFKIIDNKKLISYKD